MKKSNQSISKLSKEAKSNQSISDDINTHQTHQNEIKLIKTAIRQNMETLPHIKRAKR
jgi:hypothetical protein